ncbi:MAG: M1 family metallopeptidase [Acidimicrobiales bacterium]
MAEDAPYRLPRSVEPRRYELDLTPDLGRSSFDGTVRVSVDVVEPVREMVLNAAGLSVTEVSLDRPGHPSLPGEVEMHEQEQRLVVRFPERLEAGTGYDLFLRFTGTLGDKLRGFYRSTFISTDGTERTIATTQFEPTDARRAFPCWDEPDFKATFAITVTVDEKLTALSNGEVVTDEPLGDGRRRVSFAETMVMSTYLVALVVGPFELSAPVDAGGVPMRIANAPGKSHLTQFATEAGVHAIRFLSRYFDIPYPGSKIDHVAIPDFAFGAMENLGCVTYREHALLIDPAAASQLELQRVASVVAHETAHMWFGDLVTMKWWDGIWLNEAFATFMELATTDDFDPEWQVWTAFGAGKAAALVTDGLRATRPVRFAVGHPEEAEAMFDVLTYQKGGSVLRMLEQYLGPEAFRKGIGHYLSTHAYANTETTDLWDAIEATSGEPARAIMDSWIGQGGYPVISVARGEDPSSVRLEQRRFLYAGEPSDERWVVPINLRASVDGEVQRQRLLLDASSATVSFDGAVDWVVVDDGACGFYRARYSDDLFEDLCRAGLPEVCGPLERAGLVGDAWASVVAGVAELRNWVQVVAALGDEEDPDVWASITGVLELLDLMGDEPGRQALRSFIGRLAAPARSRLGWDPEPSEGKRTHIARAKILGALGMPGADPGIRAEAAARFERSAAGDARVAPDLLTPVAHMVAASGGSGWSSVLARYRAAETPQDKIRYLIALAATEDPELLGRTLDMSLVGEVRTQDAPFLIAAVMGRRTAGKLAWGWVEEHWEQLTERLPNGMVARIFDGIPALIDPAVASSVHAFTESHEVPMAGPRLDQLLERMDLHRALAARLRSSIASALTP